MKYIYRVGASLAATVIVSALSITVSGAQSVSVSTTTTSSPTSTVALQMLQGTLVAAPSSGAAPLTVNYTGVSAFPGTYIMTFGDSVSVTITAPSSCSALPCPLLISHTYNYGGAYQATLSNGGQTLSASVTVSGPSQQQSQQTGTLPAGFTCPSGQAWSGYQCVAVANAPIPITTMPNATACPALYSTLSRGSRGSQVLQLQNFLVTKGFLSSDSVTGFFGSITQHAVITFQTQNELPPLGVVGPLTRGFIASSCAGQ